MGGRPTTPESDTRLVKAASYGVATSREDTLSLEFQEAVNEEMEVVRDGQSTFHPCQPIVVA